MCSSHHTQKAINLHHEQVTAGRERRRQRQEEQDAERRARWERTRKQARWHYFMVMALAVTLWAAWMMTAVTGTYYVLNFLAAG